MFTKGSLASSYTDNVVSQIITHKEICLLKEIDSVSDVFVKREIVSLALNIYHEARGSVVEDMIAVAVITMNRVGHRQFRDTVEGVVFQPFQFSWTLLRKDKLPREKVWEKCQQIAYKVYAGKIKDSRLTDVYHYSRYDIIGKVKWHTSMTNRVRIGMHVYMS